MFPYADQAEDFWSGYYTSRANSKKQVRDGQATLHATQKLLTSTFLNQKTSADTKKQILTIKNQMLDALGVYQHHDAVSGTAK